MPSEKWTPSSPGVQQARAALLCTSPVRPPSVHTNTSPSGSMPRTADAYFREVVKNTGADPRKLCLRCKYADCPGLQLCAFDGNVFSSTRCA